jgi:hypothetical protein
LPPEACGPLIDLPFFKCNETREESMTAAQDSTVEAGVVPAEEVERALKQIRPGPQRFMVSHLDEKDFKANGLRPYAQYRDLGLAAATGGLAQGHVIRMVPPCTDDVRVRHRHDVAFQIVYVLKGWLKNEFEGQGEQLMKQGTCWLQPPNIKHTVLDYSDDCELLEIIIPAEFDTQSV